VLRASVVLLALASLSTTPSCKKRPTLEHRMAGSWRATMDVGARASKDPIVRGLGKLFGSGPLEIFLEVGPDSIELRRWCSAEKREVVQRASYAVVAEHRVELTTEKGTLVVVVTPNGCDDSGHCLGIEFSPVDPQAATTAPALDALGFLFGCDDSQGNIDCSGRTKSRMFFRYAKADGGT